MTARGLLLTITEPPPAMEEEFNAWYDDEHLPERLAIPGFRSARRWAAEGKPGDGRYLATYELDSPRVLDSPEYLARFGNATPWTKRCLGKTVVFRRWACEQVRPGDADPHPDAQALFLACREVPEEHEAELNRWYDEEHVPLLSAVPGVLRARRFRASSGSPRFVSLYDLADAGAPVHPQWRAAVATEWTKRVTALSGGRERIARPFRAYRRQA